MKNIGDVVIATKQMTFYVPRFHVVKVGDEGQVENTHPDVKAYRVGEENLQPTPNLVRFSGAPSAVWVGDDECQ